MRNKEDIIEILDYFQNQVDNPLTFDEEAIVLAYKKDKDNLSLPIKILSVFGGLMASLAFIVFIFLAELHNSDVGLLVFGGFFIIGSIWINKKFDKIIIDTVSVSSFIIGFILLSIGFNLFNINTNLISIVFILIALVSLIIVQTYILSFISVLIINERIFSLMMSNKDYDLIHIYVSILALTLTYVFLKEAKLITINKAFSKLYNPVRIGLIFSFIYGLFFLGKKGIIAISHDYIWLTTIIIVSTIIYLLSNLFNLLNIIIMQHKVGISILCVLLLLPTALSPAISGTILIIMLSFKANYKTGLVIGIISFIYFISQYYYDLNLTLLTKSILLFVTGILFIILYLFTHKKLTSNEKI